MFPFPSANPSVLLLRAAQPQFVLLGSAPDRRIDAEFQQLSGQYKVEGGGEGGGAK